LRSGGGSSCQEKDIELGERSDLVREKGEWPRCVQGEIEAAR
jgi:hypothetical protein